MPFRTKLKRALGASNSSTPSLSKTDSNKSSTKRDKNSKLPANVYKPGEPMPRPKYRGPWNQAHQDKLSAFSFGSISSRAGRRRSSAQASDYSPMGSRLPSRGPSRRGSAWSAFSGGSGKRRARRSMVKGEGGGGVEEAEGDGDVGNVGLSRQHTAEQRPPGGLTAKNEVDGAGPEMDGLQMSKTATQTNGGAGAKLENQETVKDGAPFTADELAVAMSQSTIKGDRR